MASFSSLPLLSSSGSTANLRCLLAITFSSLSFLSNSFSSPCFNLLRVARHCFWWSSVSDDLFFSSCTYLVLLFFASYPITLNSWQVTKRVRHSQVCLIEIHDNICMCVCVHILLYVCHFCPLTFNAGILSDSYNV